jgi:hypothetical protein
MLSTVRRAVTLCNWQQQQPADVSSREHEPVQQQLQSALGNWLPAVSLLVECLLLVPTADMTSSCLTLMPWLGQQVNAALQVARDEGRSSEVVTLLEGIYMTSLSALLHLGPAVCHCGQQTTNLKQRRQLLRLWADAAAVVVREDSGQLSP